MGAQKGSGQSVPIAVMVVVEPRCSQLIIIVLRVLVIMGNASSVKGNQPLDRKSTTTDVTDRFGGAAIGKHVIVTGKPLQPLETYFSLHNYMI